MEDRRPRLKPLEEGLRQSESDGALSKADGPLSQIFHNSKKICQGMRELDSFGFKTNLSHVDPSLLLLYRSHFPFNLGFHVCDLWSQRQQQEFLKAMKLERAQMARERQAHFVNFLAESKKKLSKAVSVQDLETEAEVERQREAVQKYRSSAFSRRKEVSQVVSLSPRQLVTSRIELKPRRSFCRHQPVEQKPKRVVCLDDFIGHCKTTLKAFKKTQAKTTRDTSESLQEDALVDPLKISGRKKFTVRRR